MSVANYKYTSDAGNVYQISLPTDFANALGETLATGTEPYLAAEISPRYAVYVTAAGTTRAALISTTTLFGSLPATLTVSGATYKLRSAYGETIPPFSSPLLISPQGPQGPKGDQFTPALQQHILTADVALSNAAQNDVFVIGNLAAGTYLVLITLTLQTSTNGEVLTGRFVDASAVIVGFSTGSLSIAASSWATWTSQGLLIVPSGTYNFKAQCIPTNPGASVRYRDSLNQNYASSCNIIQLA